MTKMTRNNQDTLKACRYCPMCRHACPSEFIGYRESDSPRGRAILLHNAYLGGKEYEPSIINAIYNCFLCGACKSWCEGHEAGGYDIPELIKFAIRDIVRKGLAPGGVRAIRNSLITNDNSRNTDRKLAYTSTVVEKAADVLYILGEGVNYTNPEIAKAFIQILKKCRISYTLLKDEPTSGKELDLLGYRKEAIEKANSIVNRINAAGCKTIVVSDPLVYDALKNDYPSWGLNLEEEILHVSEYLHGLISSGKLELKPTQTKVTLADSEYLGRYNDIYETPREVIKTSAGENFLEMQWNQEYLQSAGEAAFTYDGSHFNLGVELGRKISRNAECIKAGIIITLSATAKNNISAATDLKVIDIAEFVAGLMI